MSNIHTLFAVSQNISGSSGKASTAKSHFDTSPSRVLGNGRSSSIPPPRPSKVLPTNFDIPFNRRRIPTDDGFVPQVEAMQFLEKGFLPTVAGEQATKQKVVVIWGADGMGKTRLAGKFVSNRRGDFTSIFFLDASSRETLQQSLKESLEQI